MAADNRHENGAENDDPAAEDQWQGWLSSSSSSEASADDGDDVMPSLEPRSWAQDIGISEANFASQFSVERTYTGTDRHLVVALQARSQSMARQDELNYYDHYASLSTQQRRLVPDPITRLLNVTGHTSWTRP